MAAKKKKAKRDACYSKVKARYTRNGGTWPSAYGSGILPKRQSHRLTAMSHRCACIAP